MPEDDADLPSAPPAAGDSVVFGHFHVPRRANGSLWELGRGAMGVTYRAFDTGLRVEVALKVIAADKVADANTRARFQREARAAAKIRHPHVASVLHLGEQDGEFFYAMEFIAGRPLSALLAEANGPLPPPVAVALAAQVAAALNAAHRKEVVHRDLKPDNLMVLEGDAVDHEDERTEAAGVRQLKVIDFGLARRFGAGRQEDSFVTQSIVGFIGTPAYASPEQAGGDGELDGRSDLYSLGVILWEMLTGRLPFAGNPMVTLSKHLTQAPPFERLAGLPDGLAELLGGLLEKDPAERRPQTAGELRGWLDGTLRGLTLGETNSGWPAVSGVGVPGENGGRPAGPPLETTVLEPGTTLLERYRLGREVGHGDGGRLFLAADHAAGGRTVALKLLPPERVATEPGFLAAAGAALDGLRQCPHPVFLAHDGELQRTADTAFFAREWADGFSLLELLRVRGALRAGEVLRLLDAVPAVLDHAASTGEWAFPWLELALHKFFVVLPDPENDAGSRPDWPGLRSQPVESWPPFALRLNPLGFPPPSAGTWTDLTRVGTPAPAPGDEAPAREEPAAAVARLVRELLGAPADGRRPVTGLDDAGNVVLARGREPGAFAGAGAFWESLRGTVGPGVSPREVLPVPPLRPPPAHRVPARRPRVPAPLGWGMLAAGGALTAAALTLPWRTGSSPQAAITPPTVLEAEDDTADAAEEPTAAPSPGSAPAGEPAAGQNFRNAAGVELIWIPPGTFTMGSPVDEAGREVNETPHRVTLTRGYWMGKFEVTQAVYQAVMGTNPSRFKQGGSSRPVENVSWDDAKTCCAKLTQRERAAGRLPAGYAYGLPTEAQWEYACRAGTTGAVYNVDAGHPWTLVGRDQSPALDAIARYRGNVGRPGPHPVGRKLPNSWGLHDTIGNVWEWCEDWLGDYPPGAATDPRGPDTGTQRISRGGSWTVQARHCRAAERGDPDPGHRRSEYLGFRLALIPSDR